MSVTEGESIRIEGHEERYHISSRSELLRKAKEINIPIHGTVPLTLMATYFIDNRYFQRLTKLNQLGACLYIFPGAVHKRFEHSIGTYYLSTRLMTRISSVSDSCKLSEWLESVPELEDHYNIPEYTGTGLNKWIMELVNIAALCHDVGHGPYSHLFDDIFIKNSSFVDHPMATHEQRSCILVERIVKESPTLSRFVSDSDIKFIQSLIDPGPEATGFLYQVVSNPLNGLDVDKFDYINRDAHHTGVKVGFDFSKLVDSVLVIDNKIVYPEQAELDIYQMYNARHAMHRRVYGHKGVVSAQYIISEIMEIVDKVIHLAESIDNLNKFVKMTDEYILSYVEFILDTKDNGVDIYDSVLTEKDYTDLRRLSKRLQTHDLYPHIGTFLSKKPIDLSEYFNKEMHMIYRNKIGYVSGDKLNPLDCIYVYKTKDEFIHKHNITARKINKRDISLIIPDIHQELVTMIFRRDRDVEGMRHDKEVYYNLKNSLLDI